jgi:hypothetical protein
MTEEIDFEFDFEDEVKYHYGGNVCSDDVSSQHGGSSSRRSATGDVSQVRGNNSNIAAGPACGGNEIDDDDDDDDDDSDNDRTAEGKGGKSGKGGKRPTVKEHSKAQREKRKKMLDYLESQAEQVSQLREEEMARSFELFERFESRRKLYRMRIDAFLQLWFSATPLTHAGVSGGDSAMLNKMVDTSLWDSIIEINNICISMPVLMSFWVPPTGMASTKASQRLRLSTFEQIKGYKAGFNLLCTSIARFGTNVVEALIFNALIKTDSYLVAERTASSRFSVVSKNAKLCGASNEISFGGMSVRPYYYAFIL